MKTFRRHRRNGPRYSKGDVWTVKETPWLSADERVVIVNVGKSGKRRVVEVSSFGGWTGDIPVKKLKKKLKKIKFRT